MPSTADLLLKTSRTFALAIPLLPEPTRTTVCLAYLLFRIADTLEDAEASSKEKRVAELSRLGDLLCEPESGECASALPGLGQRRADPE